MWSALYPGQGSQHVGMGKFLFDNFTLVQRLFEQASDTLKKDFKKLCFSSTEAELKNTVNTQPALFLISVASYQTLLSVIDKKPLWAAGHSVGEYAALVNAKCLDFEQGLRAIQLRADSMSQASPPNTGGMMAVLKLTEDEVKALCAWGREHSKHIIEVANFNSPLQTVLSGKLDGLQWILKNKTQFLPEKSWKGLMLPVSAPFHSSLMKPAEEAMSEHFQSIPFSQPLYSIVSNVNAQPTDHPKLLKKNIVDQICSPVQWTKTMSVLEKNNIKHAIELGPGVVLKGLMKKTFPEISIHSFNNLEDVKNLEKNQTHLT